MRGSLDPEDWQDFRALGHQVLDKMVDWLAAIEERPLHNPVPEDVALRFSLPLPDHGEAAEQVWAAVERDFLPYPHGNIHPRFWGWVVGSGTPIGMLAELVAGGMNSNSGFGNQAAIHAERQVLRWLRQALALPSGGGGLLTSGCTVANLSGLAVARNARAGWNVREQGVGRGQPELTVYGSAETHSSVLRVCELLGLGRGAFRSVPTTADHKIDVQALVGRIDADRIAGARPVAIVGNAGTVNVGALDDLAALAEIARERDLWLHVDGAFGALAAMSPTPPSELSALGLADSVAFDLHKWLHVPYDVGCVLFRDSDVQSETFSMSGDYLSYLASGLATGPTNFMEAGLQMSRGFRALKVWVTLRHYGRLRLGESIGQNIAQAAHLAELVLAETELELMAPVPLNIVNLRFAPAKWSADDPRLNELNRRLLIRLHDAGDAAPSHTNLGGRFVIRVSITNHRTTFGDLSALVQSLLKHGRSLVEELR